MNISRRQTLQLLGLGIAPVVLPASVMAGRIELEFAEPLVLHAGDQLVATLR